MSNVRRRGLKRQIVELMDSVNEPMHYRDITVALKEKGHIFYGQTPHLTVNSILSRGPEFERIASGTYRRSDVRIPRSKRPRGAQ